MKRLLFVIVGAMVLLLPYMLLQAQNGVHEIQLTEIVEMSTGFNIGDSPLDEPGQSGDDPTPPTDFHAIINGHVLSVAAPNGPLQSRLIVNKVDGTPVVNFPFRRTATVNLADTGEYTLTIKTGNHTFQGNFTVTD